MKHSEPNLQAAVHLSIEPATAAEPPRVQYPYSVVAGGVRTPEELARARRTDHVVREHYSDFGENPVFRKAEKDLLVYVSYRKHDRIYWTRAQHLVRKGEAILSDGDKLARVRCGNRLSAKAQVPTEEGEEPAEDVLGTPAASGGGLNPTLASLPEANSYVAPTSFSDLPVVATPVNGGTIEIPAGASTPMSGSGAFPALGIPAPRVLSAAGKSESLTPAFQNAVTTTTTPAGSPSGTQPPNATTTPNGVTPTGDFPTYTPPFIAPRPPAAVPEPNLPRSMWLVLLGGLAFYTFKRQAK